MLVLMQLAVHEQCSFVFVPKVSCLLPASIQQQTQASGPLVSNLGHLGKDTVFLSHPRMFHPSTRPFSMRGPEGRTDDKKSCSCQKQVTTQAVIPWEVQVWDSISPSSACCTVRTHNVVRETRVCQRNPPLGQMGRYLGFRSTCLDEHLAS